MFKGLQLSAAFAICLACSVQAHAAADYAFKLTEYRPSGDVVSSWMLPANPASVPGFGYGDGYFGFFEGVAGVFQGDPGTHQLYFYNSWNDDSGVGGFLLLDFDHGVSSGFGPIVFTGETADPTFRTGSFDFASGDRRFTMLISANAIPEPATWAMLIAGFGVVGMAARRRRAGAGSVMA